MAEAIDVLDNLVREELPAVIVESLPTIAPIYKYINRSSIGVKRDTGIGRQWKVLHIFETGLAGLMQSANPLGVDMTTNTYYPQSHFIDTTDTTDLAPFPTATDSPHVNSIKRELVLQMSTGNFSVPVTWAQGDALSSSQIAQVARDVKAVGKMRALTEAQSFFMGESNALCQIDDYALTDANESMTFTVKSGTGRTQFFRIGMMVDIYYNNSGAPNWGTTGGTHYVNSTDTGIPGATNYVPLIVSNVDYLSGTIKVSSVDGTNLDVGTVHGDAADDDDWIVLRQCGTVSGREMRTWGLEDWIKNSSSSVTTVLGTSSGIDTATYSQFSSSITAINGPLTDQVMNGYFGGFLDAYPGSTLDTIITTMGVTLKYLEQPSLFNNRMVYERTGKALDVAGGWEEVKYSFNGKSLRWIISPMCLGKTLYGMKLNGGNITRYCPPTIGGSDGRIGGDVEFLAPLGGHSGIFKIAHNSSGQSLNVLEAPFWQYGLIAPIDVRSLKLTGLTEATGVIE